VSFAKQIEKALRKKPETLGDLVNFVGNGKHLERAIMREVAESRIHLQPPRYRIFDFFIASLSFLLVLELLPSGFLRSITSLLVLFLLPYFWTYEILKSANLDTRLTIGLVVAEIMSIGLILGSLGILSQQFITLSLIVSLLLKMLFIAYLRGRKLLEN
jgi:hypothetical protein